MAAKIRRSIYKKDNNLNSRFPQKFSSKKYILISIFALLFFIIAGFFTYKILFPKKVSVKEMEKKELTEMKTIPPDVKKSLAQQPIPASISATVRVPILLYHYVEYVQDKKDKIRQSLNVNPNVFEQQIVTLQNAGYTFITAKDLGDVLDGKINLPQNPIILSFDDGHWDLDTVILPILKKYHVKVTAYIVPGFIGGSDSLSQVQLQDVISSGLVDVGAHTVHHMSLKRKLLPIVQYEVGESKTMLEQKYNMHVYSFAYPYGSFDTQAISVVKSAGFTTASSTIPGIEQNQENRFFLYRLRPGYRTGQSLLNWLQQSLFKP